MTYFRVLFAFVSSWFIIGCAPHISEFKYVSLENVPEAEVVEVRQPDIEGVYFAREMPIYYKMEFDEYFLHFTIDDSVYMPNITVEAQVKDDGRTVEIRPAVDTDDSHLRGCRLIRQILSSIKFSVIYQSCNLGDRESNISFEVILDGNVIREDFVRFDVKGNGYYFLWDAL
ncbi:hypothetical protein [Ferrimonas balearica]|uniref:hypothetical protein n=1 Tax=Ferrimonas balearica TaxID=44012 RepID=UPI001F36C64B|nr:hypothetical protein [Ferrimonas balearica]MBY6093420.1 hypothetical protein [Ferrimonas balearica]